MTYDFSGTRVLITGGARGIGYATAEAFVCSGADVVACDRDAAELAVAVERLAEAGHGSATGIECDLADSASITSCVVETVRRLGGVDVLVNNAGIGSAVALVESDDELIDAILNVNLRGLILMSREVVKVMQGQRGGGNIVNISSLAVKQGAPNVSHYAASKGGVLGFTIALAAELAPAIRVNAICPGIVDTPMMKTAIERSSQAQGISFEEAYEQRRTIVPMGRLQQPGDIAKGVLFLASDEASEITGEALNLTGGIATW